MASPIANAAGGQIAIQATLTMLIHMFAGLTPNPKKTQQDILDRMTKLIDNSAIPDLPAADQKAARDMAKKLIEDWVMGGAQRN